MTMHGSCHFVYFCTRVWDIQLAPLGSLSKVLLKDFPFPPLLCHLGNYANWCGCWHLIFNQKAAS